MAAYPFLLGQTFVVFMLQFKEMMISAFIGSEPDFVSVAFSMEMKVVHLEVVGVEVLGSVVIEPVPVDFENMITSVEQLQQSR
jgi:hypothetical protein